MEKSNGTGAELSPEHGGTTQRSKWKSSHQASGRIIVESMTQQEWAMEASLRVAWQTREALLRHWINKRVYEWCDRVMLEGREKDEMKGKMNQIPLSDSSAARRTAILTEDLLQELCDDIKKAQFIIPPMDESTWMTSLDRGREGIGVTL